MSATSDFGKNQTSSAAPPIQTILNQPHLMQFPTDSIRLQEFHKGSNGKLLIHIQDAHTNYSAQINIAKTLDYLMTLYPDLKLVLTEGGEGDGTLTELRQLTGLNIWKKQSKRLVMQSFIDGIELANLTTHHPMKIIGIEDINLYKQNIQSFVKINENKDSLINYLNKIQNSLDRIKQKQFPQMLLDYEEINGFGLLKIERLAQIARLLDIDISSFYAISNLLQLKNLEGQIDYMQLNRELRSLMQVTAGRPDFVDFLAPEEKISNKPRIDIYAFLARVEHLAPHYFKSAEYGEASTYLHYLSFLRKLDVNQMEEEGLRLKQMVYKNILPSDELKLIHSLEDYIQLMKRAVMIKLSSHESKRLKSYHEMFPTISWQAFINKILEDQDDYESLIPFKSSIDNSWVDINQFYQLVQRRDDAFIERLNKAMFNEKAAFLVTGGYHSKNLTSLLKSRGFSYVVLAPVIGHETNREQYEETMISLKDNNLYHTLDSPLAASRLASLAEIKKILPRDRQIKAQEIINRLLSKHGALSRHPFGARLSNSHKLSNHIDHFKIARHVVELTRYQRALGTYGHKKAFEYVENQFRRYGYEKEAGPKKAGYQIQTMDGKIPSYFHASIPGKGKKNESLIITAHLDSVFRGADDNASGVAALLEYARILIKTQPGKTIHFLFVGDEEFNSFATRQFINDMRSSRRIYPKNSLVVSIDSIGYSHFSDGNTLANKPGMKASNLMWMKPQELIPSIWVLPYTNNGSKEKKWWLPITDPSMFDSPLPIQYEEATHTTLASITADAGVFSQYGYPAMVVSGMSRKIVHATDIINTAKDRIENTNIDLYRQVSKWFIDAIQRMGDISGELMPERAELPEIESSNDSSEFYQPEMKEFLENNGIEFNPGLPVGKEAFYQFKRWFEFVKRRWPSYGGYIKGFSNSPSGYPSDPFNVLYDLNGRIIYNQSLNIPFLRYPQVYSQGYSAAFYPREVHLTRPIALSLILASPKYSPPVLMDMDGSNPLGWDWGYNLESLESLMPNTLSIEEKVVFWDYFELDVALMFLYGDVMRYGFWSIVDANIVSSSKTPKTGYAIQVHDLGRHADERRLFIENYLFPDVGVEPMQSLFANEPPDPFSQLLPIGKLQFRKIEAGNKMPAKIIGARFSKKFEAEVIDEKDSRLISSSLVQEERKIISSVSSGGRLSSDGEKRTTKKDELIKWATEFGSQGYAFEIDYDPISSEYVMRIRDRIDNIRPDNNNKNRERNGIFNGFDLEIKARRYGADLKELITQKIFIPRKNEEYLIVGEGDAPHQSLKMVSSLPEGRITSLDIDLANTLSKLRVFFDWDEDIKSRYRIVRDSLFSDKNKPESYSLIWASHVLEFEVVGDRRINKAIKKVYELLMPGGMFLSFDWMLALDAVNLKIGFYQTEEAKQIAEALIKPSKNGARMANSPELPKIIESELHRLEKLKEETLETMHIHLDRIIDENEGAFRSGTLMEVREVIEKDGPRIQEIKQRINNISVYIALLEDDFKRYHALTHSLSPDCDLCLDISEKLDKIFMKKGIPASIETVEKDGSTALFVHSYNELVRSDQSIAIDLTAGQLGLDSAHGIEVQSGAVYELQVEVQTDQLSSKTVKMLLGADMSRKHNAFLTRRIELFTQLARDKTIKGIEESGFTKIGRNGKLSGARFTVKGLDDVQIDEVGLSAGHIEGIFEEGDAVVLKKIRAEYKLPNPRTYNEPVYTSKGIEFFLRKSGPNPIFSVKTVVIEQIRSQNDLHYKSNQQLPFVDPFNDIVITEDGFYEHFHRPKEASDFVRREAGLEPPMQSKRLTVKIGRGRDQIVFTRKQLGYAHKVWVIDKKEKDKLVNKFKLRQKQSVPKVTRKEIIVSGPGLKGVFKKYKKAAIRIHDDIGRAIDSSDEEIVRNEGESNEFRFMKRQSGVHTVWVFEDDDEVIRRVAEYYNLKIRRLIQIGKHEVSTSEPSAHTMFRSYKRVHQSLRSELGDPLKAEETEKELEINGKKIKFNLRLNRVRPIWVYHERHIPDIAKHYQVQPLMNAPDINELPLLEDDDVVIHADALKTYFLDPTEAERKLKEVLGNPGDKIDDRMLFKRKKWRWIPYWTFKEKYLNDIAIKHSLELIDQESEPKLKTPQKYETTVSYKQFKSKFMHPQKSVDAIHSIIGDPELSQKNVEYIEDEKGKIWFTKRVVTKPIWTYMEKDEDRIRRYFNFQPRYHVPLLAYDDISVSIEGLRQIFLSPHEPYARLIEELPEALTHPEHDVTLSRGDISITFSKRWAGREVLWSFNSGDSLFLAEYLGIDLREQYLETYMEEFELSDAIALLGSDPMRFQHYMRIFHPDILPSHIDKIVQLSLQGINDDPNKRQYEDLTSDYEVSLQTPSVNVDRHETEEHEVVLSGVAPPNTEFIFIEGPYNRKVSVKGGKEYRIKIPLVKIGQVNHFKVFAANESRKLKSSSVDVEIKQLGSPMPANEAFLYIVRMREDVLSQIQSNPFRYDYLLKSMEIALLKDFTYDEVGALENLRMRFEAEDSVVQRSILEVIYKKFKLIHGMDFGLKDDEELYFFQKYINYEVQIARERGEPGIINAVEQGLGKTVMTLAGLKGKPALILAPNNIATNWVRQESKFFDQSHITLLDDRSYQKRMSKLRAGIPTSQLLTNIEFVRNMTSEKLGLLSDHKPILVVDEADYLGSESALQTAGTRKLNTNFRLLLTATPINKISQIVQMLRFFYPDDRRFSSKQAFNKAFPAHSPDAMNALHFMFGQHTVRIRKRDVFDEFDSEVPLEVQNNRLPKRVIHGIKLGQFRLLPEQFQSIKELFTNYAKWAAKHKPHQSVDDESLTDSVRSKGTYISKREALRQIMNDPAYIGLDHLESPKHQQMDEVIAHAIEEEGSNKILIMTRYQSQVEAYQKRYSHMNPRSYYGGLKVNHDGYKTDSDGNLLYYQANDRGEFVINNGNLVKTDSSNGTPIKGLDYEMLIFQNNPEAKILIATYDSGSRGVDFTEADAVIYDDLAPTYKEEYHAGNRAHRIDPKRKKYKVHYYYLQALYDEQDLDEIKDDSSAKYFEGGTFDQVQYANLRMQERLFHWVMDGIGSDEELVKKGRKMLAEQMPFLFQDDESEKPNDDPSPARLAMQLKPISKTISEISLDRLDKIRGSIDIDRVALEAGENSVAIDLTEHTFNRKNIGSRAALDDADEKDIRESVKALSNQVAQHPRDYINQKIHILIDVGESPGSTKRLMQLFKEYMQEFTNIEISLGDANELSKVAQNTLSNREKVLLITDRPELFSIHDNGGVTIELIGDELSSGVAFNIFGVISLGLTVMLDPYNISAIQEDLSKLTDEAIGDVVLLRIIRIPRLRKIHFSIGQMQKLLRESMIST